MANRILCDEFQQSWISKVVPALENDVLMHKTRMLIQVHTQTSYVTCIDEFHSTAKCCISIRCWCGKSSRSESVGFSMCRFSLAQLGNPYSRAIVSCASLRLIWASKISASVALRSHQPNAQRAPGRARS